MEDNFRKEPCEACGFTASYGLHRRFCTGKKWWQFWRSNCPKKDHIHSECIMCGAPGETTEFP